MKNTAILETKTNPSLLNHAQPAPQLTSRLKGMDSSVMREPYNAADQAYSVARRAYNAACLTNNTT